MIIVGNLIKPLGDEINSMLEKNTIYKIQSTEGGLQFQLLNCSINENCEIPNFPIDSGTFISDNVIFGNVAISCDLFVDYDKLQDFNEVCKKGNQSDKGFTIYTLSAIYNSMRWVSKNYSESNEATNGVYMNMQFLETKVVTAKNNFLSYKTVKKPSYSSKEKTGNVQPKKDQSVLYKMFG